MVIQFYQKYLEDLKSGRFPEPKERYVELCELLAIDCIYDFTHSKEHSQIILQKARILEEFRNIIYK